MTKEAKLYRMVMDKHVCPYGIKSLYLLKRKGYKVQDHHLKTREEVNSLKEQYKVKTTPQIFIEGERIGGYDNLREYLGFSQKEKKTSYTPIIAIFMTTFFTAFALHWQTQQQFFSSLLLFWFVAFSMTVLAILKLRDLESFTTQFLGYDLLAQKFVGYAYLYPFVEVSAGIGMLVSELQMYVSPAALFIGVVGVISVFKAVYIEKREIKCACVGGNSNVPLGFISLTENLMMIFVSLWMLIPY